MAAGRLRVAIFVIDSRSGSGSVEHSRLVFFRPSPTSPPPPPPSLPGGEKFSKMFLAFLKPDLSSVLRVIRLCLAYLSKSHRHPSEESEKSLTAPPRELTRPSDTVSRTDPRNWEYVAEGGSTIVFSYNGPRSLSFDGMVLRLRKSPHQSRSDQTALVGKEDAEDPTVDFQELVISRLVPTEFLPHLEHVEVEPAWLEKMIALHDVKRPEKRRVKDGIDLKRSRAVLATNLIGNKGWAIEIKVQS